MKNRVLILVFAVVIALAVAAVVLYRVSQRQQRNAVIEAEAGTTVMPYCQVSYASDATGRHFTVNDFHSKDGVQVPLSLRGNVQRLIDSLDIIQDYVAARYGGRVRVNSGYRSPAHNAAVGGKSESMHPCGKAGDLHPEGLSPGQLKEAIESLISSGHIPDGGIGLYAWGCHYDHGKPRRWNG
jgi:hypothetical protein